MFNICFILKDALPGHKPQGIFLSLDAKKTFDH